MNKIIDLTDRSSDQWFQLGTGKMGTPIREKTLDFDVAVLGGGMAGICAAVAAARNGSKVVLVQDRPVLGGNASSEIRVIVHGVTKLKSGLPERETGIIEEILLLNRFYNEQHSFTVWDHVLYDLVTREPNITLMMNTQAVKGVTSDSKIISAICWQLSTESVITINAELFIDCSGDGLLAATSGALYRTGREASSEFGEKYAPKEADGWQMGATILLSSKNMGKPTTYKAPPFAIKFDAENTHPDRRILPFVEGFWWVEVGSQNDIIGTSETDRHRLMGYAYGVWDHVKNSGLYPEADSFSLDWVGSLPGRRESRRFIGDYILSEPDQLGFKDFEDAVAFGGWPLDEHNPGGIENLAEPPSFWHEHFDKVYQIPFGSLYSKNVSNLLFAGRNVSQTHVALSSSRVMGTCATMGQAVGTAAALCIKKKITPRELRNNYIKELQEQLLRDDAFIPQRPANDSFNLAKNADKIYASSTKSGDVKYLTDGVSRDENGEVHHWQSKGLSADLTFEWSQPISLSKIEIKCDTNVKKNIMMLKNTRENEAYTTVIPPELLKSLELNIMVEGEWINKGNLQDNQKRLIKFHFDKTLISAFKLTFKETYGADDVKLFEVRCYE
ncbi:FAD dependent oxidoreductase [Mariniflexile fucanivorans]|uniref:FAD dependent oxidoreductase n=1 Tax=Mariniflexile fucanivorans TaxID=264023 RepID=A0A4R1RKX4_9FLAO|nr:FAD-dependent oxidoreductase [Mariniflexile fucanivorans]TCL66858.1 FAD dependent oxidoreductase [Mariniflexile fucanivorans]